MKKSISDLLSKTISPLEKYSLLIQPWYDGWLLHLYTKDGSKHLTTVGGSTLEGAVNKGLKYDEMCNSNSNKRIKLNNN